jgi:hypothetical protein
MATAQLVHERPKGWAITRGFVAAHGALVGAVYLLLLHAPLQITNAIWQSVQRSMFVPGQVVEPQQIVLALVVTGAIFLLGLAVFVVFPFIQGGVLGIVRHRLESPDRPAEAFGVYGRAHYARLLANQGLFALIAIVVVVIPLMCLAAFLALQVEQLAELPQPGQTDRPFLAPLAMFAVLAAAMVVLSVAGMVYWMANCIVVAEGESALAAWRRAFTFCRRNAAAVVGLWLVNLVVGVLMAPLGLLGQWGVVTAWWALAALAVLNSAVIGYWGVVLAGMCMALYLDRRPRLHCAQATQ